MVKQRELDYCMLGKRYECPYLIYCAETDRFSVEVLKIDETKQTHHNLEHPGEGPKNNNMEIIEKIDRSRIWSGKGIEKQTEAIFACTEIRKEYRNSLTIGN